MDEIRTKVTQVFRYLLEVRKAWDKPFFHLKAHEHFWWQTDLESWIGVEWGERIEDAWLRVYRATKMDAPLLPRSLQSKVKSWQNPEQTPVLTEKGQKQKAEFQTWLDDVWRPWAKKAAAAKNTKKLYDHLFTLYNRLQDESDTIELAFAHGLLSWKTEKEEIARHLFVTPLELHFDPDEGIFSLYPTSKGTRFDVDWLAHLPQIDAQALFNWVDERAGEEFSPRNEFELKKQSTSLLQAIGLKADIEPIYSAPNVKGSEPLLTYSPALIVHRVGDSLWQKELTKAIDRLEEGYRIPSSLRQLVTEGAEPHVELNREETLFYPLPANEPQKEIARKLQQYDGVVVQGPPGTGKSHSIVNLICHLLAQGKRVLVTSEKERALDVLHGNIPREIAGLCVSLLGSDSSSMSQLDEAIRQIAENLETKEPKVISTKIEKWRSYLQEIQEQISQVKKQIMAREQLEQQPIGLLDEETLTPQQAAKWMQEHADASWLPDEIPFQTSEPLTAEEQKQFVAGFNRFSIESWEDYAKSRPKTADLLTPAAFDRMVKEYHQTEAEKKKSEHLIAHWNLSMPFSSSLDSALKLAKEALNKLQLISDHPWKINILRDIVAGGDRYLNWADFVADGRERLSMINDLQKNLMEYEISLPSNRKAGLILDDIHTILDRMEEKKGTGWMFQHVFGRKLSYIYKECSINDIPPRHAEDLQLLADYIEWNDQINRFVLRWNRMMDLVDAPSVEIDNRKLYVEITEQLDEIEQLLQWNNQLVQPLHKWVEDLGVPQVDWTSLDWFAQFLDGLQALRSYLKWKQVDQYYRQVLNKIIVGKEQVNAHPIWSTLEKACQEKDVESWKSCYEELQAKEQTQNEFDQFKALLDQLTEICPRWVEQLKEERSQGEEITWPEDWSDAWRYAQLASWLDEYRALDHVDQLEKQLLSLEEKELHTIRRLVSELAWQEMIKRTTPEQKRSLTAWSQNIKKIGKGTGKYVSKYRAEAQREMKRCREMVPVWIMPLHRVIETMDLTDERFDVVIVDESSQSNLFALSAWLRADKVVVVGDDKQISPEGIGVDRQLNHELMDRHLTGIPQMTHFEIVTSLYDVANRIFSSKVVLKEHFRSVPEIIRFSNQQFYDDQIKPLRIPSANDRFEPPIQAIYVPDGKKSEGHKMLNIPEAEKVVEKIVACCEDERYAGKTMGVISLQRNEQAQWIENRLREQIGEAEMLRRKLVCGDPYRFQGDERDIIFLTMVAAPNQSLAVLNKETDRRRYNVAVSRARDQLFLFHSVLPEQVHPQCLRSKLLQFMIQPEVAVEFDPDEGSYFENELVSDVYTWLQQQGYAVTADREFGDLVVEGNRARLAITCIHDAWEKYNDWEADWSRKRVLKQMGWECYHILAGLYYLDPGKVRADLQTYLQQLEIEPVYSATNEFAQEFVATTTNYF